MIFDSANYDVYLGGFEQASASEKWELNVNLYSFAELRVNGIEFRFLLWEFKSLSLPIPITMCQVCPVICLTAGVFWTTTPF